MTTTKEQDKNILEAAEELFGYSPCMHCRRHKWENEKGNYCEAFPEGMPNEIFWGKNLHKEPYPGDRGILFDSAD